MSTANIPVLPFFNLLSSDPPHPPQETITWPLFSSIWTPSPMMGPGCYLQVSQLSNNGNTMKHNAIRHFQPPFPPLPGAP